MYDCHHCVPIVPGISLALWLLHIREYSPIALFDKKLIINSPSSSFWINFWIITVGKHFCNDNTLVLDVIQCNHCYINFWFNDEYVFIKVIILFYRFTYSLWFTPSIKPLQRSKDQRLWCFQRLTLKTLCFIGMKTYNLFWNLSISLCNIWGFWLLTTTCISIRVNFMISISSEWPFNLVE